MSERARGEKQGEREREGEKEREGVGNERRKEVRWLLLGRRSCLQPNKKTTSI